MAGKNIAVTRSLGQTQSVFEKVGQAVGLWRKLRSRVPNASLCTGQAGLYQASLVRAVSREICSLLWRIRDIQRTQLHRRGISIDPLRRTPLSQEVRESALVCCMKDTRNLCTSRPPTTMTEVELFVRGWEQGADWSARNCGTAPLA